MSLRLPTLEAPARLAAFALGLALVGGAAALAGAATGHGRVPTKVGHGDDAMAMAELSPAEQSRASGLSSFAAGYSFVPVRSTLPAWKARAFRFRRTRATESPRQCNS